MDFKGWECMDKYCKKFSSFNFWIYVIRTDLGLQFESYSMYIKMDICNLHNHKLTDIVNYNVKNIFSKVTVLNWNI